MTYRILKGTWFDGTGYRNELAENTLEIEIKDGKAYDPELAMLGGEITIKDGAMRVWADAYFVPDAGELERVGLA